MNPCHCWSTLLKRNQNGTTGNHNNSNTIFLVYCCIFYNYFIFKNSHDYSFACSKPPSHLKPLLASVEPEMTMPLSARHNNTMADIVNDARVTAADDAVASGDNNANDVKADNVDASLNGLV